jgi:hypothetical protein
VVLGHVVVFGEEVDGGFGDLEVEIGVPGEDLHHQPSYFSILAGKGWEGEGIRVMSGVRTF